MLEVEYIRKFRELHTTHENKNSEDMGVVARKCHVDSWIDYGVIVYLLQARFQAHTEHYLQVSLLLPLIHG